MKFLRENQASDNDDFLNDTLTGAGIAHRCNWMFLQHLEHRSIGVQEYQANIEDEDARIKNAKTVSLRTLQSAIPASDDLIVDFKTQLVLLERRS